MRVFTALTCLFGTSHASWDHMFAVLTNTSAGMDRTNFAAAQATAIQINGYGCWCFFDGEHKGKAKGSPLDDFDSACRKLNWGYNCAIFDSLPTVCTPWEVTYDGPTITFQNYNTVDIDTECETRNTGDPCKINACKTEMSFIRNVFITLFTDLTQTDTSLRHTDQSFSHLQSCPGFSHLGDLVMNCCGEYTDTRKPYNEGANQERKCCAGVTYLDAIFDCCPEGNTSVVKLAC